MREFTFQKYTKLELFFHKWKWVRKLSKGFWVKLEEPGYDWVKFDKTYFKSMKFPDHTKFNIEDYTI